MKFRMKKKNGNVFYYSKRKKTVLDFSQGTVRVLQFCFDLMQRQYKMTQCNNLNVNLSNSQLNELKPRTKNGTEVT